jgi:hypothetical protein
LWGRRVQLRLCAEGYSHGRRKVARSKERTRKQDGDWNEKKEGMKENNEEYRENERKINKSKEGKEKCGKRGADGRLENKKVKRRK